MTHETKKLYAFALGAALWLALSPALSTSVHAFARQQPSAPTPPVSANDKRALAAFEKRARDYAALRERIEKKLPKLSKDSTPEQITAHKTAFMQRVKAARKGAHPNQIFSPAVAAHIRAAIKEEFKGAERKELLETVMEADTKGVPLRVNDTYPDSKELVEMPPTLLLKLPQLPKQLRYRFVGKSMLLVDRENGLIVDYMLGALP